MKATGIIRPVDSLGRIVLPIEIRKTMDINIKDSLEIFVDDNQIILKKYNPSCLFCGSTENIIRYKDRLVCKKCLEEMSAL